MIKIENLTKYYGSNRAVNHISFEINDNEILGFLGPNGAGKSTTMNMIAGYLPMTSGSVSICGVDIHGKGGIRRLWLGVFQGRGGLCLAGDGYCDRAAGGVPAQEQSQRQSRKQGGKDWQNCQKLIFHGDNPPALTRR